MNSLRSHFELDQAEHDRQWFRDAANTLFLIDVGLMFSWLFFQNAGWISVLLQFVAAGFAVCVLYLAYCAAKVIPASLPWQRPIGVTLYIASHFIQFVLPGQIPLALAGFLLIASPLAIVFLFAE